jgi:hypothetical protein
MDSSTGIVSLSTDIRPPRAVGPDAIVRAAAEAGARGVHFGASADLELALPIVLAASRAGLEIDSLTLPLAERPLRGDRRLPRLSAPSSEERAAAIALAEQGAGTVAGVARRLLLDFGSVTLATPPWTIERAFARRALDDDEDDRGARGLADALAERRHRRPEVMDACRWALEALVPVAERHGATLVIPVGATPWHAPSPREAGELLALFTGAPVGLAWDPGRLSVLAALGLAISDDRLKTLAERATLAVENDAVGLRVGYLPGLGERDPRLASLTPAPAAPVVLLGDPDTTDEELTRAVAAASSRVSRRA